MSHINPYTLQMQITQMFTQGQLFFALTKVKFWLREHNQNPLEYEVIFHQRPAPPGSQEVMVIEIELQRRDGQPVDPWLQEQANLHT
ncbi:hypothetical protein [Trichormus azollae]|uniref:hypothetical protein n=1 Tax=Trichormus azollae TaxID=1164 RepID=UPI00325E8015